MKLIEKLINIGDDVSLKLLSDEEKQFRKLILNIDELKGKDPVDFAHDYKKTMEEIVDYYKKNPQASRQQVILELDYNQAEYTKFVDKYAVDLNVPGKVIAATLVSLNKNEQKTFLENNTSLTTPQISDIIEQMQIAAPRQISSTVTETMLIEDQDEIIETVPTITPKQKTRQTQNQTADQTQALETTQVISEETLPSQTPVLKISTKQKKKRRELNLALFSGKKLLYRVNYQYKGGRQENIGPLEARSLPDALGKAQRKRTGNKTLPTVITVTFIGEKRK